MKELILLIMLQQPKYYLDDTRTHYNQIANAISQVTSNPNEMAALLSHAYHESRFAAYVTEGRCLDGPRGAQCDLDRRTGKPRARTPWQVWAWCSKAWNVPDGSNDALIAGARCALSKLRMGVKRCGSWQGAFAQMYRSTCESRRSKARYTTMVNIRAQMMKLGV